MPIMAHSLKAEAKQYLKNKVLKAAFLLKSLFNGQNLLPKGKVTISLFRKFIILFGIYGSEIWGAFCNSDKKRVSIVGYPSTE